MIANYHTHTALCRHASGTEREYVEEAIKNGLKILGFADHAPQFFPTDYYSHFRMFPEQLEQYVRTVTDLRDEYKNDIEIHVGLEVEYYPEIFDKLVEFIKPYGIEYLLLGQHYIGNEYDTKENSTARFYDNAKLTEYVDQVLEAIGTGKFSYIAHPDVFRFEGEDEAHYIAEIKRLCEGAKALRMPLEINILGLDEGRHYPSDRLFKIAREVGCDFVFGCDAHAPVKTGLPENIAKAEEFAARNGITPIETVTLIKP